MLNGDGGRFAVIDNNANYRYGRQKCRYRARIDTRGCQIVSCRFVQQSARVIVAAIAFMRQKTSDGLNSCRTLNVPKHRRIGRRSTITAPPLVSIAIAFPGWTATIHWHTPQRAHAIARGGATPERYCSNGKCCGEWDHIKQAL